MGKAEKDSNPSHRVRRLPDDISNGTAIHIRPFICPVSLTPIQLVSVMACVLAIAYGPSNGLGRHIEVVSEESLARFRKGDYIFSHFYNLGIAATKLSVLALYHRIFETPLFRKLVVGTAIFVTAWILVMEIVLGAGCRPVAVWWGAAEGPCIDKIAFTFFTNITNIVADLWIFSMPIPTILRLQALKDRRLSLCLLFSVGLGTCVISAARLGFVFAVGTGDITCKIHRPAVPEESLPSTGWGGPLAVLSCWEPCGGVLCANLPIIYKSFVQIVKQVGSTVGGGSGSRDGHSKAASHGGVYNEGRLHDWTRINNSGKNDSKPAVTADASANSGTEMRNLDLAGIVVQKDFTAEESRLGKPRRGSDTDASSSIAK